MLAVGVAYSGGAALDGDISGGEGAQAPYGGTKNSGYGKFDGRAVIDEFTELKWITIEPSEQNYPV